MKNTGPEPGQLGVSIFVDIYISSNVETKTLSTRTSCQTKSALHILQMASISQSHTFSMGVVLIVEVRMRASVCQCPPPSNRQLQALV